MNSRTQTPPPPDTVLLNPGPVNVDPEVRRALNYPDVCHREPEVAALMSATREKIARVCGGSEDHIGVLITGSGTAALEAAFASIVPPDGRILILDNGHYGKRLREIVAAHGVPSQGLEFGWTNQFDLGLIDRTLAAEPAITHVGMVHHETSTGMLNPLREVGELVARHCRSLAVDAISSLGSEALDLRVDHIDWCVGTANKCLEGLPGISFVCAPRSKLRELGDWDPRGYYLDLHRHFIAQEDDEAPAFTPAAQILYAFDRALDLALAETPAGRGRRYRERADELRACLDRVGLQPLLAAEEMANSVTVSHLPAEIPYAELHDALKQRGFVVYATQPQLGPTVRIANMGCLTAQNMAHFTAALEQVVGELQAKP
ncbi:MAG TPA: aminotransferase class V-fold PLP-dependent enzyme [Solirubrobacterales bacterium]|nr:aminotransferase class V-fold PLP-dependent enzyme [Solirubrobacterales bacterium]